MVVISPVRLERPSGEVLRLAEFTRAPLSSDDGLRWRPSRIPWRGPVGSSCPRGPQVEVLGGVRRALLRRLGEERRSIFVAQAFYKL